MFLRVTHVTYVGMTLKSKKLTPHFIGPIIFPRGLESLPIV